MLQRCVMAIGVAAAALAPAAVRSNGSQTGAAPACQTTAAIVRLPELPEASGLAASRATPGRLWAHNDSGKPEIFALDAKGRVTGRVSLSGAALEDWEAMASAPCGSGTCLYVADIGDNSASRREIAVYRVAEPSKAERSVEVDAVFRASYPDGAHDAEALLAAPDGTLFIVTKGDTGPVALYRFPRDPRPGTSMRLERIGPPLSKGRPGEEARITDGAISPDGAWAVLRTRSALIFYRAADFLKGEFREIRRADLQSLGEPQGEGVTFGPANTVYVAGEGGGGSLPGTLAILSCPR